MKKSSPETKYIVVRAGDCPTYSTLKSAIARAKEDVADDCFGSRYWVLQVIGTAEITDPTTIYIPEP